MDVECGVDFCDRGNGTTLTFLVVLSSCCRVLQSKAVHSPNQKGMQLLSIVCVRCALVSLHMKVEMQLGFPGNGVKGASEVLCDSTGLHSGAVHLS